MHFGIYRGTRKLTVFAVNKNEAKVVGRKALFSSSVVRAPSDNRKSFNMHQRVGMSRFFHQANQIAYHIFETMAAANSIRLLSPAKE